MSRFGGEWYSTNTLHQSRDGLTEVQAHRRLVEVVRRICHALIFDQLSLLSKS